MLQGVKQMRKRGKHGRMAGDRRVLQADEALVDIHTSPPIPRGTSDVVDSFPAVAPLHRTCLAADTVPHPAVSSQDGQDNPQRESVAAAGVALAAVVVGEVAAAAEVVAVVAAADDLRRRRTVWYAMLPPAGQYR